jgi:hypothetical protein
MANKLYLAILFALLIGCQGGWDKNPRLEGLPPEVKQEEPSFMAAMRDSIFILSDLEYEFIEGQDALVEFDVKVLQADIDDIQVEIPGLEEYLTGATQSFDPATGKFTIKWQVPEVFVRGIENKEVSYDLEAKVYIKSKNGSTNGNERPIRLTVLRKLDRPEILSVERTIAAPGTTDFSLKENDSLALKVRVRDPNSSSGRVTVAPPILTVEPPSSSARKAGHHLMTVDAPSQDANDPTIWNFVVRISTTNLEITRDSTILYFELRAYSPMAASDQTLRSQAYSGSFRVLTRLGDVAFTGGHRVTFREGAANSVTFAFYDPRGEGRAIVDNNSFAQTCKDKGATCECRAVGDNQVCEIWWSPKSSDADPRSDLPHSFKFKAQLQHKSTNEQSPLKEFEQVIHVRSAF